MNDEELTQLEEQLAEARAGAGGAGDHRRGPRARAAHLNCSSPACARSCR
jgi:hypothetical protein